MDDTSAYSVRYRVNADNSWDAFMLAGGKLSFDTQSVDGQMLDYQTTHTESGYTVDFLVQVPHASHSFAKAHVVETEELA